MAEQNPFPLNNVPHVTDPEVRAVLDFVLANLTATHRTLLDQTALDLRERFVEPEKRRTGMVVYADGTTWDPGSGAGIYTWDGAAWVFLGAQTLTTEQVQDIAGAMVAGNTETRITVTYQDADGTIDFEVTDTPTFVTVTVDDEAYDASGWDGDLTVPTKNAVRDKIETLGGAWEFIGSASGAGGTIDFTDIDSTYIAYMFVLTDIDLSADAAIEMLTDGNGGASYDTGASDYEWLYHQVATTPNYAEDFADAQIVLTPTVGGGGTTETHNGRVWLFNPAASEFTVLIWDLQCPNPANNARRINGGGRRLSAAAVDAIRFQASTGNITSGTIYLYGLVPS